VTFSNCTQAYNAGYSDIPQSSPLYSRKLDRDGDGIACDNPPPGFTPNTDTPETPAPGASTGTATPGDGGQLPLTGPGEVGVVGALLLAAGAAAVVGVRRRRRRFHA
jgi:hypothetical protein